MKIVRRITYEGEESQLREQMRLSVRATGLPYPWLTTITVEHLEGPQWETDGTAGRDVREETLDHIREAAAKLANKWQDYVAADVAAEPGEEPQWTPEVHELLDLLAAYDNTFRRRPR